MSRRGFRVEDADWHADNEALRQVRESVFVREQKVPETLEWDGFDADCEHLLARDDDGRAIGTARLAASGKIERMAVLREWRGRGIGTAMLTTLLERSRQRGHESAWLHAQVDSADFYRRFGFRDDGDEFMEAGIRHRVMRLPLAQPSPLLPAPRTAPPPPSQPLTTASRTEARDATLRLLGDARHAVAVHSRDLDPAVLDDDEVLAMLRRLAGAGRGVSLRFLLHDPSAVLRRGHRLIDLAQRRPGAVQLRVPVEDEDRAYASAFVLNDVGGYLLYPLAGRPDGRGSTGDGREHALLQRYFDAVWERARSATELRQLAL